MKILITKQTKTKNNNDFCAKTKTNDLQRKANDSFELKFNTKNKFFQYIHSYSNRIFCIYMTRIHTFLMTRRSSNKSVLLPTTQMGIGIWLWLSLSWLLSSSMSSRSRRTSSKDSLSSTENTRMNASPDLMASCLIAGNSYDPLVSNMSSVREPGV